MSGQASCQAGFRVAAEGDLERLVDIHTRAYPDERSWDVRKRNFQANPLGTFEHLHVALVDNVIVGHAFLFPLRIHVGGQAVPVGGVATVGVAPEARGTGVASAMLEHLHGLALARGDAATVLYPFR